MKTGHGNGPNMQQSPQGNTTAGFLVSVNRMDAGLPSALALSLLRVYKRWVSPMIPSACRFHPTCSEYMMGAIQKHGLLRGVGKGLLRLLRCHPFHEGGFDPVR